MKVRQNIEVLKAGERRQQKLAELLSQLEEKPKMTPQVKAYLAVTNLSLKKALSLGYVSISIKKRKG